MMRESSLIWRRHLAESPLNISNFEDDPSTQLDKLKASDIALISTKIKEFTNFNLYETNINTTYSSLFAISDDNITAYYNIKYVDINPAFTSIIGGTIHRNYPDPIAPTLEIARRAYFKYQKDKFYPMIPNIDILNEQWKQTLKDSFVSWREIADWLKKTKMRYRLSVDSFESAVFRMKSKRSIVFCRFLYV